MAPVGPEPPTHPVGVPSSRAPVDVLAGAFLFNLGQGVLRPSLPLYLQQVFGANYRMVTLIPFVFGAGRWVASLPTGYLQDRLGRRVSMVMGLIVIAACDVVSVVVLVFPLFLGVRGVAGMGWAMFGTVATTAIVDRSQAGRRGRAISLLLMSETSGLLLGSLAGGWLYQQIGDTSPFFCEAGCMVIAAVIVGSRATSTPTNQAAPSPVSRDRRVLGEVVRTPGVLLASLASAATTAIQTGVIVFLLPLFLTEAGHLRPQTVGYVVGLSVLGRLAALWLGGRASDRRDRLWLLAVGLLGYGAVLASLTLITDPILLGLWSFALGAAGGFVAGLPTAIVGDRVAVPLRGVAIGWLRTAADTGMLVGPLLMGALADAIHLGAPFLCGAVILCLLAWRCHRQALALQTSR